MSPEEGSLPNLSFNLFSVGWLFKDVAWFPAFHAPVDMENLLFAPAFHIDTCVYIYINIYKPAPSKGCQMVPKRCQFTIPTGLIGTPLKVLVCNMYLLTWYSKIMYSRES